MMSGWESPLMSSMIARLREKRSLSAAPSLPNAKLNSEAHCRHGRELRNETICEIEPALNVLWHVANGFIVYSSHVQCVAFQLCPSSCAVRSVLHAKLESQSDCDNP